MENAAPVDTPVEVNLKLSKFDDNQSIDSTLYRSLVGSLLYLTATRPDLIFSVSMLSRFMESPGSHWEAGKRVLRYVCGTTDEGIFYKRAENSILVGYCNSNWGGSINDSKSTSGYVFNIGSGSISWSSRKQPIVTLSTAESEYVALASAACQAPWLKWVLEELKYQQTEVPTLFCDNSSAISLAKNPVFMAKAST